MGQAAEEQLRARDRAEVRGPGDNCGNIFAPDVTKMKFSRAGHAVGLFDVSCLCNRNEFIEHAVHSEIARSRLMNKLRNRSHFEIGLNAMRVECGRKALGALR